MTRTKAQQLRLAALFAAVHAAVGHSLRQTSSLSARAPEKVEPPHCKENMGQLVAAGPYHTCARNWSSNAGAISCFGWNEFGQVHPLPPSIANEQVVAVQVASGTRHSCAIATAEQVLVCIGGGVDNGWMCDADRKCEGGSCTRLGVRPQDAPASLTAANVYCWGSDSYGQAPQNLAARLATQASSHCSAPTGGGAGSEGECYRARLEGGQWRLPKRPLRVCCGGMHTCVLWADGSAYCFGCNGDGCRHNQTKIPASIQGQIDDVTCGLRHSCALLASGEVVCWGDNEYLQASAPRALRARRVSAGPVHTCAVASNQSLVCWGSDRYGESSPPAGSGYVAVSAGLTFACALRSTLGTDIFGRIECWGNKNSIKTSSPEAAADTASTTSTASSSPSSLASSSEPAAAEITEGTLRSSPPVPEELAKRDFFSISVGFTHVCVTDAVDLLLHCYYVASHSNLDKKVCHGGRCV